MTWRQMTQLEPRLAEVLADARAEARRAKTLPASARVCANDIWYGTPSRRGLKSRVELLVGYASKDTHLQTSEAYDVAVNRIYEALPDCRNCGCGG